MAYEAQHSISSLPLVADRDVTPRGQHDTSDGLGTGSWLGLMVAMVVILAGAVTVYLGPPVEAVGTLPAPVETQQVAQITE